MKRPTFVGISLALASLATPLLATPAHSADKEELVVFAASSLREVFQSLALAFERQHGNLEVHFNFAGSQDLRVQIEHGAQADAFASADWKNMKSLVTQDAVEHPAVFARNLPVVVVAKNGPAKVTTFADLQQVAHLVVGAPEVPIGAYAEAIFTAAEEIHGRAFVENVRAKVSSRELNARQVLTKVAMGEADAGIVYKTDALTMADKVQTVEIPAAINVVAEYPIAVLKATPRAELARAFVKLVLSKEGEKLLGASGFGEAADRAKR